MSLASKNVVAGANDRSRRGGRASTLAGPDPVDIHVGARVKLRRVLLGLSQGQLGAAINLTFQQVQKYERGANRISASMLHRIAQVLDGSGADETTGRVRLNGTVS